ncbi:MAG: RHS repeat-associated core domain-containing protein, partial [Cyclobacteriaceae bacterium]
SSTTDEQNHEVRTYTDKLGRVILKKVQAVESAVLSDTTNHWTNTYYIYDDYGLLRYVLQPQLVRTLVGMARNPNATDLARFAFQYQYDGRNRMVQKQVPGAGAVYMVYDQRNRVVLTQDANQRNQPTKEWTFTKYDELNRPVLTGKYASTNTLAAMQAAVNTYYANLTASQAWYETYIGSTGAILGYDNKSFPQTTNAADYYTASYYDRYDTYLAPAAYAYTIESPALNGQPATANTNVLGLTTASLVKVLTTGAWLRKVTYYDVKYRPIQVIADHPKGTQRTTNLLDFAGRTIQSKRTYIVNSVSKTISEIFTYDHGSRLTKLSHSIDGASPVIVAQSNYNELGQPIEKNLHSTDGINHKQSVDFSYNIRGWMTGINQSNITAVAGGDAVADYFGMDLAYNNPFSGLSAAAAFNGNISSIKWSSGSSKQQAYAFDYDAQNRLLNAHHFDNDSVTWARHWRAYSEMGISYDLNGNILKLKRYGYQGQVMDNLTYGYQGNQLKYVHDTGSTTTGFVNGNTGTDDYTYDNALLGNGNMTADKNKGITAVNYNYLNLPQQVNKGATDYVVYTYDAAGRKWAQQVFGSTPKTTDYLGELIYEGGNLQSVQMGEGRVLPDGAGWEYQYYLKDHLGNVHVTFTTKTQTTNTVTAGFETANQTTEATKFKNYPSASHINVVASNANSGSNSLYLNGAASGQVGVAKDYAVMPGDVVQIQAYAKYLAPTGTGSNLANFAPALLSAFNLGAPAPGETGTASSAVQSWGQLEAGGYGNGSTNSSTPKVFVTILLFDRNYNFLDVAYQQLGSSGAQMNASYTVKELGYAYLYVSNEHATQVDVYFDDVVMSHTPGQIVSATDYMPFGLAFRAGERQGATEQKMLYSSKELQDELVLNWYDFGARMYMPEIGRWGNVDILSEVDVKSSPYVYANNNPLRFTDPTGMSAEDEVGGEVSRTTETNADGGVTVSIHYDDDWQPFTPSGLDILANSMDEDCCGSEKGQKAQVKQDATKTENTARKLEELRQRKEQIKALKKLLDAAKVFDLGELTYKLSKGTDATLLNFFKGAGRIKSAYEIVVKYEENDIGGFLLELAKAGVTLSVYADGLAVIELGTTAIQILGEASMPEFAADLANSSRQDFLWAMRFEEGHYLRNYYLNRSIEKEKEVQRIVNKLMSN